MYKYVIAAEVESDFTESDVTASIQTVLKNEKTETGVVHNCLALIKSLTFSGKCVCA